jgi:hypothetical protein
MTGDSSPALRSYLPDTQEDIHAWPRAEVRRLDRRRTHHVPALGSRAPTAGPPPYHPYEITPATVFGFRTADEYGGRATRYRF